MQEPIAAYPSLQFYSDGLITKTTRRRANPRGFNWPGRDPVAFVNVHSPIGEQRGKNGKSSFCNTAEAMKVADLVEDFHRWGQWRESSIGVITAYASQVAEIQVELLRRKLRVAYVISIDKSQGSEMDIVKAIPQVIWALLETLDDSTLL